MFFIHFIYDFIYCIIYKVNIVLIHRDYLQQMGKWLSFCFSDSLWVFFVFCCCCFMRFCLDA